MTHLNMLESFRLRMQPPNETGGEKINMFCNGYDCLLHVLT